jgi:hypothetical protein
MTYQPVVRLDRDTGGARVRAHALGIGAVLIEGLEERLLDNQRQGRDMTTNPTYREQ